MASAAGVAGVCAALDSGTKSSKCVQRGEPDSARTMGRVAGVQRWLTWKQFPSNLLSMRNSAAPNLTVSDLKKHAGFWLRFVSNHVSHAFARKLLTSGVTVAEWVVMRELFDDVETSPGVLAERIGMTRGGVSKLVDRLVTKKLAARQNRSDDRRFQSIALTAAGRRLIPQLAALADQNDEEFFYPLSSGERTALIATMKKLVQAHSLQTLPTE